MANVRAKFICSSVQDVGDGQKFYQFQAAVQGEDNKDWAKWTPSGSLSITIGNPAAQVFEQGKAYFLDFSPVEST
jgi:hypothetical protein